MNKIFASVSALALGATGLQAAYAPGLSTMETAKPWSVSASLRGFYDDNYATAHKSISRDSFGFEVSPSASINLPMDQTFLGASYTYSLRYYEDRNDTDQTHQFSLKFDHAFNERYRVEVSDSFVIAQEPEILDQNGIITVPLRSEGDNLRNLGMVTFSAQLSQLVSAEFGYQNTLYDYEQKGFGSRSAVLDRVEHLISANLRWQMLRQTVAVFGYQFGYVDYTSEDALFFNLNPFSTLPFGFVSPSIRDNRSHYLFVGADQNFNSRLNGSVRVGLQYTDYFHQDTDEISPYADANLTFTYAPGSYLQAGIRHARNQTDVVTPTLTGITLDQESTAVYASLSHRLTSRITASLLGQVQRSVFNAGAAGDEIDNFFIFGANFSYRINPHWLAETGYNFDRLDSDLPGRTYTRNRVYLGIRANY